MEWTEGAQVTGARPDGRPNGRPNRRMDGSIELNGGEQILDLGKRGRHLENLHNARSEDHERHKAE